MTWAYIAGFFDGEGHVAIHRESNGRPVVNVTLTNTHEPTIRAIAAYLADRGITSSVCDKPRRRPWKTCFTLAISAHRSQEAFLSHLLPFLITRKDQARKVLTFIRTKRWLHWHSPDEIRIALAAYKAGASTRDIERTYGISSRSLRSHAKRLGIPLRDRLEAIRHFHQRRP